MIIFSVMTAVSQAHSATEINDLQWFDQKASTKKIRARVQISIEENSAKALQIIDKRTGLLIQEILDIGGTHCLASPEEFLSVEDANFDGYPDLKIPTSSGGAGPNSTENFYLYNQLTQQFEFNQELSDLTQVSIDPKHKWIQSDSRGSCCSHSSEFYRFVSGHLFMVASWDESRTADGKWIVVTTGKLRKGQMHYREKRRPVPKEDQPQ